MKGENKDLLNEIKSIEKAIEKRDRVIAEFKTEVKIDINEVKLDVERTRNDLKNFYRDVRKEYNGIKRKLFILIGIIISASSGSGVLIDFLKNIIDKG